MIAKHMRLFSAALLLACAGCAVVKVPVPTGGSRADGTVQMAFEYGGFEKPQIDTVAAQSAAAQRCAAWGYQGAEPFGGFVSQCQAANAYGCLRYLVTLNYQCTGSQSAQAP
jgi:hypothetical protein